MLLAAVLRTEEGPVSVGATHLSVRPDVARRQLTVASEAMLTLPGPRLLGGDLNLDAAASRPRRPSPRGASPRSPAG
ncbi:hypothetical protein [Georgenia sp. SUBG003]|uniref:hypothetical protein n=1 Tax=Georgenia sp. SUBG003 TaxID=1497974 RepID=UPI003AB428F5